MRRIERRLSKMTFCVVFEAGEEINGGPGRRVLVRPCIFSPGLFCPDTWPKTISVQPALGLYYLATRNFNQFPIESHELEVQLAQFASWIFITSKRLQIYESFMPGTPKSCSRCMSLKTFTDTVKIIRTGICGDAPVLLFIYSCILLW